MTEYIDPSDLSDAELYREYQIKKEKGPQLRLDELQLEIAQRWEAQIEERMND
jgi:hypothetical protein